MEKGTQLIDKWLEILTEKMGLGADHFYPIFIKQQIIIGYILAWSLLISIIVTTVLVSRTTVEDYRAAWNDNFEKGWQSMLSILFIIISVVLLVAFISTGLLKILNPEYYAIADISRMIGR